MWVFDPLTLVWPDITEIFGSYLGGVGTVWPLTRGVEEVTKTWLEIVSWTERVSLNDETSWDVMVGWTETEVTTICTIGWEVMFWMNEPDVGIAMED